jgi:hypothetical protein
MKILTGFTSQPKQTMTFVLDDGSAVSMTMVYRTQQLGWFVDIAWQSWIVTGLRLTASPNLLQKWENLIPFGLAILTQGNVEPLNLTDFADGIATVYLLNAADVVAVNEAAFAGY